MKYMIVLEEGADNYSAYVPDLPGCVAAGQTEEEVISLMREAIQLHIEGMRADGDPIPQAISRSAFVTV